MDSDLRLGVWVDLLDRNSLPLPGSRGRIDVHVAALEAGVSEAEVRTHREQLQRLQLGFRRRRANPGVRFATDSVVRASARNGGLQDDQVASDERSAAADA